MLNASEKLFCEEYVANGYNAVLAYQKAYSNASYESSKSGASRKLKKQEVKDYIAQLQHEVFEANCINADRIATELAYMAFERNPEIVTHPNKLKALDLLQKQLGLQQKKIDATVETPSIKITIGSEEDDAD